MYPIKAAAELAGLSTETLRAWERRHGAIHPVRDAQGRRLYDPEMIERLSRLHRLTGRGHPIRDLAALDDDALDRLLDDGRRAAYGGVEGLPSRMLDAIAEYRVDVFDRDLSVAIATLPMTVLMTRVVMPLLREVGLRWADGRLAVAQERLVSSLLRMRLLAVLSPPPREQRPRVLFATLPEERHELGLIGAALQAHEAGMPVLYLGTELPSLEIARVAAKLGAAGVALSSMDPQQARPALEELRQLDAELAPGVPVWLGGTNARYLAEELASARIQAVGDVQSITRGMVPNAGRG
ncbi:cobalamin B12-binding domain-containing protein [Lysobacter sp. S4-A87]|uniref:MerR family transcriptional regulator n=1 Tax=Lysobacter sp. S4-A87 TaxID=2925843 RepID=UPI001F531190|nr:cobalamin B12-binding domain-containing protein [Lysobacter sp. S4-A87]UNK49832.1 cobalamin B12-binding domain-containing protein [Lysobacter sp. S4-A87]